MLPAEALGQGRQQLAGLDAKQQLADQGFATKESNLNAQLPGLVLKNLVPLEAQQTKENEFQQGLAAKKDEFRQNMAYKQQALAALQGYRNRELRAKVQALDVTRADFQQRLAETVAHDKAMERVAQDNATTSRIRANEAATKSAAAAKPKYNAANSKILGYRQDQTAARVRVRREGQRRESLGGVDDQDARVHGVADGEAEGRRVDDRP
jgi:hypothetical protein